MSLRPRRPKTVTIVLRESVSPNHRNSIEMDKEEEVETGTVICLIRRRWTENKERWMSVGPITLPKDCSERWRPRIRSGLVVYLVIVESGKFVRNIRIE